MRLKRFADEFVGANGDRSVRDAFVDDTRHENDGRGAELGVLANLGADGVAVSVRHDDVGDDCIRRILIELPEGRSRIRAGDDIEILAAERDLDDFAHGGAVIDEIDGGRLSCRRIRQRGNGHRFAHCASLSAVSRDASSTSRMASSIRSVAERKTVRCDDVIP